MRRTFPARYPGNCQTCGSRFAEDDPIGYDADDEITCADCLRDDHRTTQQPVQVCPECHLDHAGNCDW